MMDSVHPMKRKTKKKKRSKIDFEINKRSCDEKNVIKKKVRRNKNKAIQVKHGYSFDNSQSLNNIKRISEKVKKPSLSISNTDEEINSIIPNSTKQTENKTTNFKKSSIAKNCKKFKMSSCTDSDDSEEDQTVRKELKNLSVYKNIQKLLKKKPMACADFEDVSESDADSNREMDSAINDKKNSSTQCFEEYLDDDSETDEKNHLEIVNKKVIVSDFKKSEEDYITLKNSNIGFMRAAKFENLNKKNDQNISEKPKVFRNKAREKLQAAKFRILNEKLYTESGSDSFTYFQKNKDEFMDYHMGYNLQVTKWPMNPVDKIIKSLLNMDKNLIIADMGCGDAKIAQTLPHSVHSFDLVALNEYVTPCNISKVPLKNESIDIVVFCLSLMGTNLQEYLQEAYRILKIGGSLKIAEVESRIPDLDNFINGIHSIGFTIQNKDVEHKLFVFLEFQKEKGRKRKREKKKKKSMKVENITLKPCLYKKR